MKTKFTRSILALTIVMLANISCSAMLFPDGKDTPAPVNIIYLIGDGMGYGQISSLIMEHAVNGASYRASEINRIKYMGIATTYSADSKVTDSAAGGTALATGEKTNNGTVGINAAGDTLSSVMVYAGNIGKSTGIVVNTPILDATPAAFYAHVEKRSQWDEIAVQMTQCGFDILMGEGLEHFNARKDGKDLTQVFKDKGYVFCDTWEQASAVQKADKMVALTDIGEVYPHAVSKAIELLEKKNNPKGFFLMIEEARIDGWGHENDAKGMVAEMEIMDQVMKVILDYADSHPGTLIVITADHETGGTSIGYDGMPAFKTKGHSGTVVPVFAYGPGQELFMGLMDNVDIPKKLFRLLGK